MNYSKVGECLKIEQTGHETQDPESRMGFSIELPVAGDAVLYFLASTHRGSVQSAIVKLQGGKEAQRII